MFLELEQDIKNAAVITALWTIMVILVHPVGNFPLNDDWVYGLTVRSLAENGTYQLSGGPSVNLFSQALWGALFCLPFGFSFTALRFSTLTLGWIGVLATYALLRELKMRPRSSLLGALLVAINPIYFGLSNTFMTDVPFYTVTTLALLFCVRGLQRDSAGEMIAGLFFACAAILIRQTGLLLPIAFGCAVLARKKINATAWIQCLCAMGIGFATQWAYQFWLGSTHQLPSTHNTHVRYCLDALSNHLPGLLPQLLNRSLFSLLYVGLFLFPFILIGFWNQLRNSTPPIKKMIWFMLSCFFAAVAAMCAYRHRVFPMLSNVLTSLGLGPLTLRDAHFLNLNQPAIPEYLRWIWIALTAIGILGAGLLIYYLCRTTVRIFTKHKGTDAFPSRSVAVFMLSIMALHLFASGIIPNRFDRYLLPLLPVCLAIPAMVMPRPLSWTMGRKTTALAGIVILLCGIFTVGATHDYLSWNRVRWQALNNLMQEHRLTPRAIDGGYEFNGWFLFDYNYEGKSNKSWWWVDRDDFMATFGPVPGFETIHQYPVPHWLPFSPQKICVLRKIQ